MVKICTRELFVKAQFDEITVIWEEFNLIICLLERKFFYNWSDEEGREKIRFRNFLSEKLEKAVNSKSKTISSIFG